MAFKLINKTCDRRIDASDQQGLISERAANMTTGYVRRSRTYHRAHYRVTLILKGYS